MDKPVLVIAGNYKQYRDYIREHKLSPTSYRYVNRAEQIMGMRDASYILVGQYYLNPIHDKGQDLLRAYNIKQAKP